MQWQEQAKTLTIGQKRKVKHCGSSPSAYINNSPRGVSLHCFRCGENLFEPHGRLSASDLLALRERDAEESQRRYPDVSPLYDANTPAAARVWVLKAGIRPDRATDLYGIGWSASSARVIVPVLHNGSPTGIWTGRAIDGRKPKYLMPRGTVGAHWYRLRGSGTACVVVEDVLSAIKVAEAGYSSLAVLGTSAQSASLAILAGYRVAGWFDGDEAGRKGFVKLRKALAPYGIEPARVHTEKDPKLYSRADIHQFIKDAL